jgi:nucleoid-associated protein YgaU
MRRTAFLVSLLVLLASGCAAVPQPELDDARLALATATAAGAPEAASAEYLAAQAAMNKAESLIQLGKYRAAQDLLPFVTAQARQATDQAILMNQERERQRQTLEAAAQQRLKAAQLNPPQQSPLASKQVAAAAPRPAAKLTSYTVTSEESLWDIARRESVYADGMLWPMLYKANRDQIKDPRRIYPGQTLAIPRNLTAQELDDARSEARESGIFNPAKTRNP